jgi:type IV secretory pathway TrbL component
MGSIMRAALVLAIGLIFAGAAHAQLSGGSINTSSAINGVATANGNVGINDGGSMNAQPTTSASSGSHVNPDAGVNANSKNPGEFVPSTFSSYQDALATAKLEAEVRPITVAEAARRSQERKKNANDKSVIQLDEDEHGNLVITSVKK